MAKRGTLDHPKTKRLGRAIGLPAWAALGLLEAVWHWVSRYCPEGLMTVEELEDCADTIRYEQGGKALAEVLSICGLLDPQGDSWYIHDWHDHADETTKKALEKAGKGFANGSQSRKYSKKSGPIQQNEQFANDSQTAHEPNATAKPSLAKPSQDFVSEPSRENSAESQETETPDELFAEASKAKPKTWKEIYDYADHLGLPREEAEYWFNRTKAVGWVYGPSLIPIKDWKSSMVTWKKGWKKDQAKKPKNGKATEKLDWTEEDLDRINNPWKYENEGQN